MRAVVVGSGIAGLAAAELLVRNGHMVTLLEKSPDLGGDASRRTQDWWHTGWLYAGLPDKSATDTCVQAIESLPRIYGEHAWSEWHLPREMLFAYALHDLNRASNLAWRAWVNAGPMRRMGKYGLGGQECDPPPALAELMCRWEGRDDGPSRYKTVVSTDGGIDTAKVLRWMASHLGLAKVVTNADVRLKEHEGLTTVRVNGETEKSDIVIVAAGNGLRDLLMPVQPSIAQSFATVQSPILVVPKQPWPAFIRYTADLTRTVNHQPYPTPDGWVSTIGSHDEMKPGDDPEPFVEKVRAMLPFDRWDGVYLGTKTEYTNGSGRRYNHAIVDVNRNTYAIVPGKFSQFPLLVEQLARRLKMSLFAEPFEGGDPDLVGPTEPERLAASGILTTTQQR